MTDVEPQKEHRRGCGCSHCQRWGLPVEHTAMHTDDLLYVHGVLKLAVLTVRQEDVADVNKAIVTIEGALWPST